MRYRRLSKLRKLPHSSNASARLQSASILCSRDGSASTIRRNRAALDRRHPRRPGMPHDPFGVETHREGGAHPLSGLLVASDVFGYPMHGIAALPVALAHRNSELHRDLAERPAFEAMRHHDRVSPIGRFFGGRRFGVEPQ